MSKLKIVVLIEYILYQMLLKHENGKLGEHYLAILA